MATKRASKSKKQGNITKYVTWPNGDKYKVIEENEHMYFCEGTQFLKTNPYISIAEVVEEVIEAEPVVDEQPSEDEKEAE